MSRARVRARWERLPYVVQVAVTGALSLAAMVASYYAVTALGALILG